MTTTEDRAALNRRLVEDLRRRLEETSAGPGDGATTKTEPARSNGATPSMPETTNQMDVDEVAPPSSGRNQRAADTQSPDVAAGTNGAVAQGAHGDQRPSGDGFGEEWPSDHAGPDDQSASVTGSLLRDDMLATFADAVDDLQRVLFANQNRLRQMTRTEEDSDGEVRGFGLDENHPAVANLAGMVAALEKAEKDATHNLEWSMKQHPLWPWVQAQRGVGAKTAARVLAVIGDPAWHDVEKRPRRLSELRSFCGYGDPEAQRLTRGRQANWSTRARTRLWNVASAVVRNGAGGELRQVYDDTKVKYAEAEITDMHRHNRALRAVSKAFLKGLWTEARRIHAELAT